MVPWSNQSCVKVLDLSFSSAVTVIGFSRNEISTSIGRPSLFMAGGYADGISLRNGRLLISQNANGDSWTSWLVRAKAWPEVEKMLIRAQRLRQMRAVQGLEKDNNIGVSSVRDSDLKMAIECGLSLPGWVGVLPIPHVR